MFLYKHLLPIKLSRALQDPLNLIIHQSFKKNEIPYKKTVYETGVKVSYTIEFIVY